MAAWCVQFLMSRPSPGSTVLEAFSLRGEPRWVPPSDQMRLLHHWEQNPPSEIEEQSIFLFQEGHMIRFFFLEVFIPSFSICQTPHM